MREYSICSVKIVRERTAEYCGKRMTDSRDVYDLALDIGYGEFAEEVVGVFCLNVKGTVDAYFEVSRGDISSSIVHPREIFKRAILHNTSAVILVHNHPSGDITPTNEDVTTTKRLVEAGDILGCKVLDHIIVGFGRFTSLKEEGIVE